MSILGEKSSITTTLPKDGQLIGLRGSLVSRVWIPLSGNVFRRGSEDFVEITFFGQRIFGPVAGVFDLISACHCIYLGISHRYIMLPDYSFLDWTGIQFPMFTC
jgi:hypothetical protein